MKKKTRRDPSQVIAAVKNIKNAVNSGDKLKDACKRFKMSPAQYHIYKHKVFPENKVPLISGRSLRVKLPKLDVARPKENEPDIISAINFEISETNGKINNLRDYIEKLKETRESVRKLKGVKGI